MTPSVVIKAVLQTSFAISLMIYMVGSDNPFSNLSLNVVIFSALMYNMVVGFMDLAQDKKVQEMLSTKENK